MQIVAAAGSALARKSRTAAKGCSSPSSACAQRELVLHLFLVLGIWHVLGEGVQPADLSLSPYPRMHQEELLKSVGFLPGEASIRDVHQAVSFLVKHLDPPRTSASSTHVFPPSSPGPTN